MKKAIVFLAERSQYYKGINEDMPKSRSKLYNDIRNTVVKFTNELLNVYGKDTKKSKVKSPKDSQEQVQFETESEESQIQGQRPTLATPTQYSGQSFDQNKQRVSAFQTPSQNAGYLEYRSDRVEQPPLQQSQLLRPPDSQIQYANQQHLSEESE